MARSSESKSVEDQMANALQQPEVEREDGTVSEEVRRVAEQHRTDKERQKQALHLQKENILSQKTWHPARRAALEAALAQIEAQIEALK
jgi:regulator of protease activity HflC (stomatin/prohibitin superfamily)